MDQVPRAEVPDMPDRIVAATAVAHDLSLVSADSDIQGSASLKSLVQVIR
jgi:predicted nucleic acid-binding protein